MAPPHSMTSSPSKQPTGLRERKKAETRAAIQQHALRLFTEQGYTNTTIEQIAASADVSQSTFFRYFHSKEDTVCYDQLDPLLMEAFLHQPSDVSPLTAVRTALREVFDQLPAEASETERARRELVVSVPELRAVMLNQLIAGTITLSETLAKRIGRDPRDIEVRTWAGAVIGVVLSSLAAAAQDRESNFVDCFDRGLAILESGLPL